MKDLRVWQKLTLMGAVFLIPFAVVTYKMVSSVNELGVEFARKEMRGVEYYTALVKLYRDVQQHYGLTSASLNGAAAFKEKVVAKDQDLTRDLLQVNEVDARLDSVLHLSGKWALLKNNCQDLLAREGNLTAAENVEQHAKVIDGIQSFIQEVGDASKLTLDPDLDSYYLMNLTIFQGPELGDLLAQARGLGSGLAASQKATPEQLESLERLAVLIGYLREGINVSLNKAFKETPELKSDLEVPQQSYTKAMQDAEKEIRKLVAQKAAGIDPEDYYGNLTRYLSALSNAEDHAAVSLDQLLKARAGKQQMGVLYSLGWAALGLVVVSFVAAFIIRDITQPLNRAVAVANQIATGDLKVEVFAGQRKDEVGDLLSAFDRMTHSLKEMAEVAGQIAAGKLAIEVKPQSERDVMGNALSTMAQSLSQLVGQVQKSCIQVNSSVREVAATSKQQQATATEIAATTTEIGATSKEIAATSNDLLRTMNEVTQVAEQTAESAGQGQAGLARMEETMRDVGKAAGLINTKLAVLNEKAGNINQVVTTITKVADQTNLLSLNAAIEAEKAGEYGRGFAVVATEIRRLADQTAVATYDIEEMVKEMQSAVSAGVMGMDKFSEEVRRGMQEVQQTSERLTQIIQQVQAVTLRFESVNEGMSAQASSAQQISEALGQLSEAVHHTVDSLRQSNSAIEQLDGTTRILREGISRFKV